MGIETALILAAVAGAGATAYQGNQQRIAATRAADSAAESQQQQTALAQQSMQQQKEASDAAITQQAAASDASIQVQQKAIDANTAAAKTTADQQTQAISRANQKTPDVAAMLSANQQSAKGGQSGTMLTGPNGIDSSTLALGKNTLLGS